MIIHISEFPHWYVHILSDTAIIRELKQFDMSVNMVDYLHVPRNIVFGHKSISNVLH